MKIAEETGDGDLKEAAKVNFGMANASMKWTNHVSNILTNLQDATEGSGLEAINDEEDEGEGVFDAHGAFSADEAEGGVKLPQIGK